MALPSLIIKALAIPTLISLYQLVLITLFTPATPVFAWSASTILDVAADLLEPSDLSLQGKTRDPLLETIRQHEAGKRKDALEGKVVGQNIIVDEKFLVPMLTNFVGDNNQLMEYMAAALVARATKRTLCLTPFFNGPLKHTRQLPQVGLSMEERYDIELLGKFVNVSSMQRCLQECNKQIDGFWWLRKKSPSLSKDWTWDPKTVKTHDSAWSFVNWTSTDHIKQALEGFSEERCVALGGLFPGFRWRGAYLAPSSFMRPSQSILKAATAVQEMAIGLNQSFLAVHWRFEESICGAGHQLGLCFLRCGDGAVIDSGLHPTARGWAMEVLRKQRCPRNIRGVIVTKADIVAAIQSKAIKEKVGTVYLATDGWMRGSKERALVKEVVEDLRKSGLAVEGLWKTEELPNFSNGEHGHNGLSKVLMSSGHVISEVEQEVCLRAKAFMGSGESTWSLAVFRARLAARRRRELLISAGRATWSDEEGMAVAERQLMIERLLGDLHAAGLQCHYQALFHKAQLNSTSVVEERYQDEAPDSWLDIEACETRLLAGQGGACKLAACLST